MYPMYQNKNIDVNIMRIFYIIFFLGFIIISTISLYFVYLHVYKHKEIKKNWKKYKCNPLVMPLTHLYTENYKSTIEECSRNHTAVLLEIVKQPYYFAIMISKYIQTSVNVFLNNNSSKLENSNLKPLNFKKVSIFG